MKTAEFISKLEKSYSRYLSLYRQVLEASREQKKLLSKIDSFADEEFDDLEDILEKKGQLFDRLEKVDQKLAPYRNRLIEDLELEEENWLIELLEKDLKAEKLKQISKELAEVMDELNKIEQKNQQLVKDKQESLVKEINQVKKSTKVNQSYSSKLRIHSTYIDDKR